jgi:hypothetical protein
MRRLKLRFNLNKYKFEDKFLFKLSQLISKYYGKKVEFNIVNLKSIGNNPDIFSEILALKLKKETWSPIKRINHMLSLLYLPKVNTISERSRASERGNKLIPNIYKNPNINSILVNKGESNSLDNLLKRLYSLTINESKANKNLSEDSFELYHRKIRNTIFELIKYKIVSGARLSVKGRLTRRYRADRALYKFK